MNTTHLIPAAVLALSLGFAMPVLAGEGHDHGDATPVATGKALPRFAAVSESFELVGVLDGKQVTLYLDRFADNTPVRGAKIDLEIAGAKFNYFRAPEWQTYADFSLVSLASTVSADPVYPPPDTVER